MSGESRRTAVTLVVPCFNESQRLDAEAIVDVTRRSPNTWLILVDDGSTDRTLAMLHAIASGAERVDVIALGSNGGKGEAVRAGLLHASATGVGWVGYVDSDLATPPREIARLVNIARDRDDLDVVLGARVAVLGRDIQRSSFRHYTGRVFATLASNVLAKPVYDTQCGAKVFRNSLLLTASLQQPFSSRWAFDVELLARLDRAGVPPSAFWEEPLMTWHDVAGSKRSLGSSVRATADLFGIWRNARRAR